MEYARFVKNSTKTRVNFNNCIAEKKNKYGGLHRQGSDSTKCHTNCASQCQFAIAGLTKYLKRFFKHSNILLNGTYIFNRSTANERFY